MNNSDDNCNHALSNHALSPLLLILGIITALRYHGIAMLCRIFEFKKSLYFVWDLVLEVVGKKTQKKWLLELTRSQWGKCIWFLRLFTPSPPSHKAVIGYYLSSLYSYLTLYRRCRLAYPYDRRGFVGPKKGERGLLVFNPLCYEQTRLIN